MRSTDRTRRRGQSGTSLIEAVVAAALMGIGVVGGLTAWDTASMSAEKAVRLAWANCIVRSEMDAILSADYDGGGYPWPPAFEADGTMDVHVTPVRGSAEQLVTVTAYDPGSNRKVVLARVSALKASALAGDKSMDDSGVVSDVSQGCPRR
jgi:Tfp pilus assembly protein PilV